MLLSHIGADDGTLLSMLAAAALFVLESFAFALALLLKGKKKKKLFKIPSPELEYGVSEAVSMAFCALTLLTLAFMKARYFADVDKALESLKCLGAVTIASITVRVSGFFWHGKSALGRAFRACVLKGMDDFAMAVALSASPALLASQMPIAEISKYFGPSVKRAVLVNFPFAMACAYLLLSNLSLLVQNAVAKSGRAGPRHISEASEIFLFIAASFLVSRHFVPGYNLFLTLMLGVIATLIISSASQHLNANRIGAKRRLPASLERLYTISNVLTSTFASILIMCAAIFASLNLGGFYGMAVVSLAMIGSWALNSNLDVFYRRSEANKYVAKTVNNIVLFYIFYEMLESILKRPAYINIFSNNAVIGFFLSVSLVVFNILKVVNLAKYLETLKNKSYIFIRSLIYMALFVVAAYLLFPFINYEVLGAFILGLVIMTSFISLVLLNGADVFGMMSDKSEGKGDILSGTVVPLASQITTLIIVLTIILLPMVK